MNVRLPRGCTRLDVLVGKPANGVKVWLWSEDGHLIAQARGGEQATVFACGPAQNARLDLEAATSAGPFVLQERAEPRAPEILERHPLAAGRLIQRMVQEGTIRRAEQVGTAEPIAIDPAKLVSRDVLVPVGRCVELAVALGPGSVGVELRVVDADSGSELETITGVVAATAQTCALDRGRTLNARAEIRATSTPTTALFATHMLSPHP